MNRIGIAVIGGGGIAAEGHIRGYQDDPRCEMLAVWDVDEARGRAQAAQRGLPVVAPSFEDLLARPDIHAVSVCTPDHTHGAICLAALQAGKHVLCEKPIDKLHN